MHFPALREALRFSLLLWLPLWLLEATRPFDLSTLVASPVSRTAWFYAGAIALVISLALGLCAALMAGTENLVDNARGAAAGIVFGSTAFLAGVEALQRFAMERSLAPHLGTLLALAVGLVVAAIIAIALGEALPASLRRRAALGAIGAGLLLWFAVVWSEIAPRTNLAHLGTLLVGALAAVHALYRLARAEAGNFPKGGTLSLALLLIIPFALMFAVDPRGSRADTTARLAEARQGSPHVLLLIVDTLRADHTNLGTTNAGMTPGLAKHAAERGTRFTAAWSAAPNTIPSMKALFTGQLSSHFGGEGEIVRRPPLEATTLAESLRDAGYATAGITANGLVSGEGFEQGFSTYWNLASHDQFVRSFFLNGLLAGKRVYRGFEWMERLRLHKERSDAVTRLALEWVDGFAANDMNRERPFFLYVHLLDPHWPYHDRGMGAVPEALKDLDAPFSHVDFLRLPAPHPDHAEYARDPRMQEMQGRYDDEIRASDRDLERMLDALETRGLLDDTLVILAGDHGEEFFEHLAFGHGQDVYVEELHVPLVFLWPEGAPYDRMPKQITAPVSLVDVLPTLHDLLELEPTDETILGQSLAPLLRDTSSANDRPPIVAESRDARGMRFAWRDRDRVVRFAYTRDGEALTTDDVSVFDQTRDPEQLAPVAHDAPGVRETIERARRDVRARGLR